MGKHTPGPWRAERIAMSWRSEKERGMALRITAPEANGPKRWDISAVYYKPDVEETEANARLIAAAPALLEALQAVCYAAIHYRVQVENQTAKEAWHKAHVAATEAMRKATGEE